MNIVFDFVINGTGEAVFLFGDKPNQQHRIYDVKGLDYLLKEYIADEDVLEQLNAARLALFDDAMLDYVPENTRFDGNQYKTVLINK